VIPVLAAISAIDTADKVATGVMALWKQMSAGKAGAKEAASEAGGSFSDILASQGAAFGSHKASHAGASATDGGKAGHVLNKVA